MLAVVLQSLNTALLGRGRPYMYTVIIKINLSRGRGHSLALLAGKDLALSRVREGRSQGAQQGGGAGKIPPRPQGLFQAWHVSREAWNGPPQQEVDCSPQGEGGSCPDPPDCLFLSSGCLFLWLVLDTYWVFLKLPPEVHTGKGNFLLLFIPEPLEELDPGIMLQTHWHWYVPGQRSTQCTWRPGKQSRGRDRNWVSKHAY